MTTPITVTQGTAPPFRAPRDLGHNPAGGAMITGRTRGEPA